MLKNSANKEYKKKIKQYKKYSKKYFEESTPLISDQDFDLLLKENLVLAIKTLLPKHWVLHPLKILKNIPIE